MVITACRPYVAFLRTLQSFYDRLWDRLGRVIYFYFYIFLIIGVLPIGPFLYGATLYDEEDDKLGDWGPQSGEILDYRDEFEDTFISNRGETVYIKSKGGSQNILTLDAIREIIDFDNQLRTKQFHDDKTYDEICYRITEDTPCVVQGSLLGFWETLPGMYNLQGMTSDADIVTRVQTGRGDPARYPPGTLNYIAVERMLGKTTPKHITTNPDGTNDAQQAQAAVWTYYIENEDDYEWYWEFEEDLENFCEDFNDNSEYINVYILTHGAYSRGIFEGLSEDVPYIISGLVIFYLIFIVFSGRFIVQLSRVLLGFASIFIIEISYYEAIGFLSFCGLKASGYEEFIHLTLICAGVITTSIWIIMSYDSLCLNEGLNAYRKSVKKLSNSTGFAIISTLLFFPLAQISEYQGLRNYSVYATLSYLVFGINFVLLFLPLLALDHRRSAKKLGDCFTLCRCKPHGKFCNQGKCIYYPNGQLRPSLSEQLVAYWNALYKKYIAIPIITLGIFLGLFAVGIYGVATYELDFDIERFVKPKFYLQDVIDVRDEYFSNIGDAIGFASIDEDFAKVEVQLKWQAHPLQVSQCIECDDDWLQANVTVSWVPLFYNWVATGNCQVGTLTVSLNSQGVIDEQYFTPCLLSYFTQPESISFFYYVVWNKDRTQLKASLIGGYLVDIDHDDKIQAIEDLIDLVTDYGPNNSIVYSPWIIAFESMKYTNDDIVTVTCISGAFSIGILLLLSMDFMKFLLHAILLIITTVFTCSFCSLVDIKLDCILEMVMYTVSSLANYVIVLIVYSRDRQAGIANHTGVLKGLFGLLIFQAIMSIADSHLIKLYYMSMIGCALILVAFVLFCAPIFLNFFDSYALEIPEREDKTTELPRIQIEKAGIESEVSRIGETEFSNRENVFTANNRNSDILPNEDSQKLTQIYKIHFKLLN